MFMRSMKNSGKERNRSLPMILLGLAETSEIDKKSALLAMEILLAWNPATFKNQIPMFDQHLFTLIRDETKDVSVRSMAIEILLRAYPDPGSLEFVLDALTAAKNKEMTAFLLHRLQELCQDQKFADIVRYNLNIRS